MVSYSSLCTMGVETNGANILNAFNMKEHFDGLFFVKNNKQVKVSKLTVIDPVTPSNYSKINVGEVVILSPKDYGVFTGIITDKRIKHGDRFVSVFTQKGYITFEVKFYHGSVVLLGVTTDGNIPTNYTSVNKLIDTLDDEANNPPHYVFDDVVL